MSNTTKRIRDWEYHECESVDEQFLTERKEDEVGPSTVIKADSDNKVQQEDAEHDNEGSGIDWEDLERKSDEQQLSSVCSVIGLFRNCPCYFKTSNVWTFKSLHV